MQVALPELTGPAVLTLDDGNLVGEDAYFEFCAANPELSFERTAAGEIVIVPPPGWESDQVNVEVLGFLREWARRDGRGKVSGPSVQFVLPDGSALGPDAAWNSNERLAAFSKAQLRKFPRLVPEFVVEVMSPGDRLNAAQKKMRQWASNGVELGWLIDGDRRTVYVYRGLEEPRVLVGAETIEGEGPVAGFVLPLAEIWDELN